jgi:hypothetical protein
MNRTGVAFDQCVNVLAGERRKGSVNFGFVAGVYDCQLDTLRTRRQDKAHSALP